MKTVLIGTHNRIKQQDLKNILESLNYTCLLPNDLNIDQIVPETADTYAENSLLKAKFYANLSSLTTVADDGGLEINALGGKPGKHARSLLENKEKLNDQELFDAILKKMKNYQGDARNATLKTVVTFFDPKNGKWIQGTGHITGSIITKHLKVKKYPIRELFYVPQYGKTLAKLTTSEYEEINFRKQAIESIKDKLNNF